MCRFLLVANFLRKDAIYSKTNINHWTAGSNNPCRLFTNMREYQNVVPTKKYAIVSITYGPEGRHLGMAPGLCEGDSAFSTIPLIKRVPVIASLLIWKYVMSRDAQVADVLTECGWTSENCQAVANNIDQDKGRINEGVELSLGFVKSRWPHDYAIASKIIKDEESAKHALSIKIESTTGTAFAPEDSKGFYRETTCESLNGMTNPAALGMIEALKEKDFTKILKTMINDTHVVEIPTAEVEFPVPNQT